MTYLSRQGEDYSSLLDSLSATEEFLRDTNCWMRAQEMENLLEQVTRLPLRDSEENILQKVGHSGPQLRSWGVLDSVLRMMPRPQEIFAQPDVDGGLVGGASLIPAEFNAIINALK